LYKVLTKKVLIVHVTQNKWRHKAGDRVLPTQHGIIFGGQWNAGIGWHAGHTAVC